MDRDRNLLFGVLAVQMRFVTPQQLMEAAGVWAAATGRGMGEILETMGHLSSDRRKLIENLMEEQIAADGGDATKSLMAFGGEPAVNRSFAGSIVMDAGGGVSLVPFGGEGPADRTPEEKLLDSGSLTTEQPGRYTLKGERGRGGIGRVLIAVDEHIGREIALKELLQDPGMSGTPVSTPDSPATPLRRTAAAVARFLREARITGQLEHPAIVPVYEVGKRMDGSLYYTMKLVRGKTMADKLDECHTLNERLKLLPHFLDICQAMAYAHSKAVVHRDIKPQNVMIGEFGETVVLDWGLAKVKGMKDEKAREIEREVEMLKEVGQGETVYGKPIGTPAYMPPEQADGKVDEIDERSDVWSLGAVLYEILTGRPPFEGVNVYEIIGKVMREDPEPASAVEKDAPPELAAIASRCLSRNKDDRYSNSEDLAQDIQNFMSGGLVSAYDYSAALLAKRWIKKRLPVVLTASLAAAFIIAFGVWSVIRINKERNTAVKQKEEAMINLAESFMILARWAESKVAWGVAGVYYSRALALHDGPEARYSVNYAMTTPPVSGKLMHSLEGHTGPVLTAAFSPDGKQLASGGSDGTVRIWDASDGKLLHTLEGHENSVVIVRFSPDGKVLASASDDSTVKLWDPSAGMLLHSLEGHTDSVGAIAFSPDGKIIASAANDNTVRIWKVSSGKILYTLEGHTNWVVSVDFSPDGAMLASGSYDGTVKIWDPSTGKPEKSLAGHTLAVNAVAFSPDGKKIASGGSDNTVVVSDVATGEPVHVLKGHTDWVTGLAFSPDGTMLASAGADKSVKIWDTAAGSPMHSMEGHRDEVTALAFRPDGKFLATASADQTVKIWDPYAGKLVYSLEGHTGKISSIAFSADGAMLASASSDKTVRIWDSSSNKLLKVVKKFPEDVFSLCFLEDGKAYAAGSSYKDVKVREVESGVEQRAMEGHEGRVTMAAFRPDGKTVATAGMDNTVKLWDVSNGKLLWEFGGQNDEITSIALSRDGKLLASGGYDQTVKIYDAASSKLLHTLEGHTSNITALAFSPDGTHIATGSRDKTIKLYDLSTGNLLKTLDKHTSAVTALAFSPDGSILASGSGDSTIILWAFPSGEEIETLKGHANWVTALSFRPDGKVLASGSDDKSIKLWQVTGGKLLHTLERHRKAVSIVVFSRDGKFIASADGSGTIIVWPFPDDIMTAAPAAVFDRAEREAGLKLKGTDLFPWNPASGASSDVPIPRF